jgi:hypothetical protein
MKGSNQIYTLALLSVSKGRRCTVNKRPDGAQSRSGLLNNRNISCSYPGTKHDFTFVHPVA